MVKKILVLLAVVLCFGMIAGTIGVAADIYSLFGARNKSSPKEWPNAKEYVAEADFEDGYSAAWYASHGCEIKQLKGTKALKQYTPTNTELNTYCAFMAQDLAEEHRLVLEDGENVYDSSVFWITVDLMNTEDTVYFEYKLEFKGPHQLPNFFLWIIDEDGYVTDCEKERIVKLSAKDWTTVGVRLDLESGTCDYYVNGHYERSKKVIYDSVYVKKFSIHGAEKKNDVYRSIYADNFRIFFEEE